MLNVIDLVLSLLTGVLSQLKGSTAADAVAAAQGIEAAIASLTAVQGTPVTYNQLESLRVKATW
jgi:hypothetical protein